ncbi:MAG: hypothetical protein K2P95_04285, partial [Hyphomonadaceae bacterium]|nr:hypothetical protein [Hyphomonadaceae bacterium]
QLIRVSVGEPLRPGEASPKLRALLAARTGFADFAALEAGLGAQALAVRALLAQVVAPPASAP